MKPKPTPVSFTTQAMDAHVSGTFPLTQEFQGMLLKMLLTDAEFGTALKDHIQAGYFQNQVHQWMWTQALSYRAQFWAFPTLNFLINLAYQQAEGYRELFAATATAVRDQPLMDEAAVRGMAVEFIRRNAFRQAYLDSRDLFNAGKFDAAYDHMKLSLQALENVSIVPVRRSWLAEGFIDRHIRRQDPTTSAGISSGIPQLDKIFENGGIHLGEVALWLAYPKAGKTTFLCNLGLNAARISFKPVLHCICEGSLAYVENRYDTILSEELYSNTKKGEVDAAKYAKAVQATQYLKRLCVLRDFTELFDRNILHIDAELSDLKRTHGFDPELLVVDYVDLLRARTPQNSETEHQKAAMQDLKSLASRGRGYAVWTACQAQRPANDSHLFNQELLTSAKMADAYAKVRIADFIGSINQTHQERDQGVMRLYAELYRDGKSNEVLYINADFSKMHFGAAAQPVVPGPTTQIQAQKAFTYKGAQQQGFSHGKQ